MGVLFTLQGSLLSKNGVNLLGFNDIYSIYPLNFTDRNVTRNGFGRILASSRNSNNNSSNSSSSSKSLNNNNNNNNVDGEKYGIRSLNHSDNDFDDDTDDDNDDDDLSCFRGLVLDISYRPVNVVCWKRAICLEFMEKADVLEYYDQTVNSPSGSFNIPAVLRVPHLLHVVKRKRVVNTLSRKNIFFRDEYTCQYCSAINNLTIDHVLPISRGGKWEWENLVTACSRCNCRKGQKTLEEANMNLLKAPKAPKEYDILAIPLTSAAIRMMKVRKGTPQEWNQYLP